MMELPIRGIIPPMVTPLNSDNELDDRGLENLINHMIDGGVHGIFLLGTTGEATSFRYELRKELITKSCKITNDRVPLMVGITDTSPEYSVEMAEFCKDAGVQSVVVAAPYYFPISQSEVKRYFDNLVPRLPCRFCSITCLHTPRCILRWKPLSISESWAHWELKTARETCSTCFHS